MASGERSAGVEERSMLAGVLQEPGRSRSLPLRKAARASLEKRSGLAEGHRDLLERTAMDSGYGEVKATKPSWMEFEKSESADSTGEGGEPTRWDPVEGSGRSERAFFWRDRW
jgi:hypothetical protein